MKIRMLFMIIVGILFVLGCGQEIVNERHEIYFQKKVGRLRSHSKLKHIY